MKLFKEKGRGVGDAEEHWGNLRGGVRVTNPNQWKEKRNDGGKD